MAEDKFEQAVIEKLKSEGWDYLSEYSGVTVDRLYDHWRDILNANNRKRLEDTPLSDNEFEQVKLELTKNKTPYDAQLMLAGAGGVGTVPLNRDDGTQLELEIFYGDEVAGGHSRYEVVNQITFTDLATSLSSKRRIDIMLLINGLPVAHIEEKDESLQNQWNAMRLNSSKSMTVTACTRDSFLLCKYSLSCRKIQRTILHDQRIATLITVILSLVGVTMQVKMSRIR